MTMEAKERGAAGGEPRDNHTDASQEGVREARKRTQRRFHRRKVCRFCVSKAEYIDYKDVRNLRRYVSDRAKMLPRRMTGCCAKHQRMLTQAIERARILALLPFKA